MILYIKIIFNFFNNITNSQRYKTRYNLYEKFEKYINSSENAVLYTIEAAFGDRPHTITKTGNPRHIQLRTDCEIWHKEALLNIAISRLPVDAEYIAWIDADVTFARPDWAAETLHQLQHHPIVQMFSTAIDLDPEYDGYDSEKGIVQYGAAHIYQKYISGQLPDEQLFPCFGTKSDNKLINYGGGSSKRYMHTGYAYAIRREAFDAIGGLMDFNIVGCSDHSSFWGIIGHGEHAIHGGVTDSFKRMHKIWHERAAKALNKDIGYVPGLLLHYFHGAKKFRNYIGRWQILIENKFDPLTDIRRDWQGLYSLTDDKPKLRDDCRNYFRQRNEDDIRVV